MREAECRERISFLWNETHNRIFTDMGERYVNPAELVANESRIQCLSSCWKELVFLLVFQRKA